MLKVFDRADEQRTLWDGSRLEVGPLGGDQRLTAVRQYEHELQAGGHPCLPQDVQRLSEERVMRTRDGHTSGTLLMMGSVWWFPLTGSITTD